MEASQEKQEEAYVEESSQEDLSNDIEHDKQAIVEEDGQETEESFIKSGKLPKLRFSFGGKSSFVHGVAVGLGLGCIGTFIIVWISLFFAPQLPAQATYETLLAIFIYPLIYLLAVGLIALTAGIVREYYSVKPSDDMQ